MFVRIVIVLIAFALDYLSPSSAAIAGSEGGNEYIQATTRVSRPRGRGVHRHGTASGVRWFVPGNGVEPPCDTERAPHQRGIASWYGPGFHGRQTASGARYDMHGATVAHKTLPLGTEVCIKNPANDRIVVATVNDRGPYVGGRIVDLSKGVADALRIDGVAPVEIFLL